MPAQLHFPENAFPLHLLLERLQRLVDIVFTNEDLHLAAISFSGWSPPTIGGAKNFRIRGPGAGGLAWMAGKAGPITCDSWLAKRFIAGKTAFGPRIAGDSINWTALGFAMAILKIARMGHPVLLQRCATVADPGAPEIRLLVADMMETMEDAQGAGLAAPQVHMALRIFVFRATAERAGQDPEDTPIGNSVLINPTIEFLTEDRVLGWEGCLSIPGMRAAVPRAPRVRYRGVDCDGTPVDRIVSGFHARVVQHENDHLDGVLYPMRMTDFSLFGYNEELSRAAQARYEVEQASKKDDQRE